jgi:hypothetical protein
MARDPLRTVLRLRQMAVDSARTELVARQENLSLASRMARDAEAAIAREMAAASVLDAGDGTVEAFAAWLPRGRAQVAQALAQEDRAQAEASQAHARLSAARTALEVVLSLLAQRTAEHRAEAARRLQSELDEVGRRRRPSRQT